MTEQIAWTLNVAVPGGPKVPIGDTLTVDAYDVIDVNVADASADTPVEIQPGGAGSVRFLLVKASSYGDQLTYKVNEASADAVTLDAPLALVGAGAVALLGDSPQKLLVSNDLGQDISLRILVGRTAT
jgi:hypothetical protein